MPCKERDLESHGTYDLCGVGIVMENGVNEN